MFPRVAEISRCKLSAVRDTADGEFSSLRAVRGGKPSRDVSFADTYRQDGERLATKHELGLHKQGFGKQGFSRDLNNVFDRDAKTLAK